MTVKRATLCLLNPERAQRRLGRLSSEGQLATAARRYSAVMVRQGFFDHVGPGGSTLVSRVRGTRYLTGSVRRWWLGENLAWGAGEMATPRAIVRGWMNSDGHRRNVLDRRRWRTRDELHEAIVFWIEHTYNRRRRQRALGKLTPVEYE
ncbi:MAG: CAP domain-containing protein, partial [Vicinamibacteria bacterium]